MNGNLAEVKEMESLVDSLDTSLFHDNKNNNSVIKRYLGKGRNFLYMVLIGGLLTANIGYSQEINVIQEQKKDLVSRSIDIDYKKNDSDKKDWLYHAMEANYMALNIADFVITHEDLDMGAKDLHPVPNYSRKNRTISALYKTGTTFTALSSMRQIKKEAKKDWLYHAMEASYAALNIAELVVTYKNIDMGAIEVHPIAKLTIENRPLTYFIYGGVTIGTLYATRYIKKENKKAAYITLGILNIFHGYVFYHNIQVNIQLKKRL